MTTIIREFPNSFNLPKRIEGLAKIAHNLWWAWNPDGQRLFSHIDPLLWNAINHNPIAFLRRVERTRINAALNQPQYLEQYDKTLADMNAYLANKNTWFAETCSKNQGTQIAYFSFEFGLHESLPVYAGGLGILSGDHLKEASDLGLPLTAVGFVYNQGYFVQHLSEDGWQETRSALVDYNELPLISLLDDNKQPLTIAVNLPGRQVTARIWELEVGRIHLYLLDTNLEQNSQVDRQLTERLYNSDPEIRISQEILLGIGGVRALELLGFEPNVWHMNEGHSAFLAVERLRKLVNNGMDLKTAVEKVRIGNVFTTHTPVPAGNDQFPLWLIDKYFAQVWNELGMTRDQFIDLGRQAQPWGETFVMPVLALKLSERANAVSELHGTVSRKMWSFLYPDQKVEISFNAGGEYNNGFYFCSNLSKGFIAYGSDPQRPIQLNAGTYCLSFSMIGVKPSDVGRNLVFTVYDRKTGQSIINDSIKIENSLSSNNTMSQSTRKSYMITKSTLSEYMFKWTIDGKNTEAVVSGISLNTSNLIVDNIPTVTNSQLNSTSSIYDINGFKVRKVQPGKVYIQNGKKKIIY